MCWREAKLPCGKKNIQRKLNVPPRVETTEAAFYTTNWNVSDFLKTLCKESTFVFEKVNLAKIARRSWGWEEKRKINKVKTIKGKNNLCFVFNNTWCWLIYQHIGSDQYWICFYFQNWIKWNYSAKQSCQTII